MSVRSTTAEPFAAESPHPRLASARFVERFPTATALWWTLRVGAFLCFMGHGAFGILTKEGWVPFFTVAGIGRATAFRFMPLVGIVDVLVGTLTLVQPRAAVTAYLVLWALWTAALRPHSGQPVWELLERAGNYGVPFALLLLTAVPARWRAWRAWRAWVAPATMRPLTPPLLRQVRRTLAVTTALLLLGHGVLSLHHKPELVAHYAVLLPAHGAMLARNRGSCAGSQVAHHPQGHGHEPRSVAVPRASRMNAGHGRTARPCHAWRVYVGGCTRQRASSAWTWPTTHAWTRPSAERRSCG